MNTQLRTPLRFRQSIEQVADDETEAIQGLVATLRYITEKTFADGGHAIRGVHAKSHGICRAISRSTKTSQGSLLRECSQSRGAIRL